ncbi:oligopeptide transport system ATP-binding protein [Nocardioides zeae]|uniref:Oligopeptide transport system ATP-binding protein n=1 Tax=Nocardioides zeae TaxID=1457234 RepID=A0ACC6IEG5_9ACTN|nr:ABC transporter ATP-binding protein [Nocardioides zeae]MDR6174215.1 oligopeptide transport system ATP-binding protein [Nocardioides zeae]MDR6209022.1 oligopeptide transport system ATP-binding protein [Nocardioides zeae]
MTGISSATGVRTGRRPGATEETRAAGASLVVEDLVVDFTTSRGIARAVNDVSFRVEPGERVAIVGESGCGKSTTALALLGLLPTPPAVVRSGSARLDDVDLLGVGNAERRRLLGREVGMVFQDALSSFSPVMTIGRQVTDGVRAHEGISRRQAKLLAAELLAQVGIPDPARRAEQYPHELSGGMRQRAMIAMALAGKPRLLIADEPTTALDVTVQAQVLDLVKGLEGLSILWITHDLGVVASLADRVVVMYAGTVVEQGPVRTIFRQPAHPYTRGLLRSVPNLADDRHAPLASMPGLPPDLADLPAGCPFVDRCPEAVSLCSTVRPRLTDIGPEQAAACHVTAGRAS